ncbi:hypothetical protein DW793_14000, partial [Ruminococcus sp. AM31-15AC]
DIGINFILASKDSDDINLTSSIEIQKVCEIGLSFISTKQIGKIRFSENMIFRLINEKPFIKVKFAVPFFLGMKCFVSISKGKAIQIIE